VIPLAKSLRPDQHRELVDKQDAEQRALERPPSVEAQIDARFHAIANDYGVVATQKRAARNAGPREPPATGPYTEGRSQGPSPAFERVGDKLRPDHFFEPLHGRLYGAIQDLIRKGQLAEPIILVERFRRDPAFEELGGLIYLADLVDRAPPAANAPGLCPRGLQRRSPPRPDPGFRGRRQERGRRPRNRPA
jgi:hypothetical protein